MTRYRDITDAEIMLMCFRGLILAKTQAGVGSPCHKMLDKIIRKMKARRKIK